MYALVEDDVIVEVTSVLPKNWKNVTNFYMLANDEEAINKLGWQSVILSNYDKNSYSALSTTYELVEGKVYQRVSLQPLFGQVASDEAKAKEWKLVRAYRDRLISEIDWRYSRYFRQKRLGLSTTDNIEDLDKYIQQLADITDKDSPFDIEWPVLGEKNGI